jgi:type IV pilus assembly protein PilB
MPVTSFPSTNNQFFPSAMGGSQPSKEQGISDYEWSEEHRIAHAHGRQYLLPVFDPPSDVPAPIDPSVSSLLCGQFCKAHKLVPVAQEEHFIDIAVTSPESLLLSEKIQQKTGRHMRPMFSPLHVVERLLETMYPSDDETIDSSEFKPLDADTSATGLETSVPQKTASQSPKNPRVGTRPNRYLSDMLNSAISGGATAIYFDVVRGTPRVRWRVNSQLIEHDAPTTIELYDAMIGQIKRLAKIDSQQTLLSESSAFNLRRDGLSMQAIANILRTESGEQLVLKLRDSVSNPLELSSIGLTVSQQRELQNVLQRTHGLYLFVGPSHSGRTTTQYACMNSIDTPGLIRCTIESRIAQAIAGAMQLTVDHDSHNGWSDSFDACSELDPDVTLIELLDDRDFATRCMLAGASNQRVLTSVRATTSLQAISQLRQLGLDGGLIADSLRCIVAQRLVRRLCERCREEEPIPRELAIAFGIPTDKTAFQSRGCSHCHDSGYVGNTGVFEVLNIHPRLRDAISLNASAGELAKLVRSSEIVALDSAVIEKLVAGETSVSEATRAGLLRI